MKDFNAWMKEPVPVIGGSVIKEGEPGPGYVNQDPDIPNPPRTSQVKTEICQEPNCGQTIIVGTQGKEPEGIGCDTCRQCGNLIPWADQGL